MFFHWKNLLWFTKFYAEKLHRKTVVWNSITIKNKVKVKEDVNCKRRCTLSMEIIQQHKSHGLKKEINSQTGSRTMCLGVALLGLPGPPSLTAMTRNSYSDPSVNFMTEYVVSGTGNDDAFVHSLPFSFFSMIYPGHTQKNKQRDTIVCFVKILPTDKH